MKRLMILTSLVALLYVAGSVPGRRGLVVNEVAGKVVVNTHPQQPMDLNPWQQPRLVVLMEWKAGDKHSVSVKVSFVSLWKSQRLCSGASVFGGGEWQHLGDARYEVRHMKSGFLETLHIITSVDMLHNFAYGKTPWLFRVCGIEFYLHQYEMEDLKQAWEIWSNWQ